MAQLRAPSEPQNEIGLINTRFVGNILDINFNHLTNDFNLHKILALEDPHFLQWLQKVQLLPGNETIYCDECECYDAVTTCNQDKKWAYNTKKQKTS